jgi:acyl-CoA synthetase (NDP forming)
VACAERDAPAGMRPSMPRPGPSNEKDRRVRTENGQGRDGADDGHAVGRLLRPRSIAIVGATPDTNKLSGRPQHFLTRDGFAGRIYPVNPRYPEIAGIRCWPSVDSLPEAPDAAIVAVAAARVLEAIEALGRKGCPVAIIFSSGFGELGAEGKALEARLLETARAHGVRLCGPNTLGLVNAFDRTPATFSQYADKPPLAGPVGFASQSGAFGTGIAALARSRGLGFGYFVSTGNTADLTPVDCLAAMLEDERVRVLAGYLEGAGDGPALLALAARAIEADKPLVMTKVGRHAAGARAAASHTGSLAGEDRVFDAVLRQHGVLRARNEEHMLDLVQALACWPEGAGGDGIALVTMSGGAGVLMADRAEEIGLRVPLLDGATRAKLAEIVPAFGATQNPIDVTGAFLAEPRILPESVAAALEDPALDVAVIWLQLMHGYAETLVEMFRAMRARVTKPFVVCWLEAPEFARLALQQSGIPVIGATERAVDAAAGLVAWGRVRRQGPRQAPVVASTSDPVPAVPAVSLRPDRVERVATLPTMIAKHILERAGLPLVPTRFAATAAEAAAAAATLGLPVALKIESPDIPHKTEAGGVRLALATAPAVEVAAREVLASARAYAPGAALDGLVVQRMAPSGVELVLGLRRDPVFGHIVLVGLGGILVEVLGDVQIAAAPIDEAEAHAMLDRLAGRAVLEGARGKPAVAKAPLAAMIAALSRLAVSHPEIEELDLNPVLAGPEGVLAVDWLVLTRQVVSR